MASLILNGDTLRVTPPGLARRLIYAKIRNCHRTVCKGPALASPFEAAPVTPRAAAHARSKTP